jgi:predicted transcriptional regulator
MKTAVSIPDPLFEAADELARRLGLSRSALYARALARELASQGDDEVTAQLDVVYAGVAVEVERDEAWAEAGRRALLSEW